MTVFGGMLYQGYLDCWLAELVIYSTVSDQSFTKTGAGGWRSTSTGLGTVWHLLVSNKSYCKEAILQIDVIGVFLADICRGLSPHFLRPNPALFSSTRPHSLKHPLHFAIMAPETLTGERCQSWPPQRPCLRLSPRP